MARIAGTDLPREKRVEIGLTYIFGIGRTRSTEILKATGINPDTRVKDLTEDDIAKIRDFIDKNYRVEGDLRRDVALDIKRLEKEPAELERVYNIGLADGDKTMAALKKYLGQ